MDCSDSLNLWAPLLSCTHSVYFVCALSKMVVGKDLLALLYTSKNLHCLLLTLSASLSLWSKFDRHPSLFYSAVPLTVNNYYTSIAVIYLLPVNGDLYHSNALLVEHPEEV